MYVNLFYMYLMYIYTLYYDKYTIHQIVIYNNGLFVLCIPDVTNHPHRSSTTTTTLPYVNSSAALFFSAPPFITLQLFVIYYCNFNSTHT